MIPRSPARKAIVLIVALGVAGLALWVMTREPIISGTKSTFSFVGVKAPPGGVAATTTTANTSGTSAKTASKTTSSTSTPPAAGGR